MSVDICILCKEKFGTTGFPSSGIGVYLSQVCTEELVYAMKNGEMTERNIEEWLGNNCLPINLCYDCIEKLRNDLGEEHEFMQTSQRKISMRRG